ncbi:similar to Saccharomyces cerevisiae YKR060W UTP30 Subunit of U3-containing 90S preribosome complex involved in production of 18S rRNA and assembly of small ribosomal subunit [Maudiozyma barnettii]|uniref:Similar to Saccharomyces cerevisiae YKR060W UTP30 Subunit of U3-containing 90S preribosome complex involved in production of 18S rRNA and assembly of small ribosomal subunit n=1 Tax=Maudiozyma barnettii TaxID=61262 RepID=A0A8H2VG78_9SACH|nr:Utp30p [Kazachstania barnettii]CAB4254609.1 similar to Saccharomyces cerevisiae YKR060W UTP30 Subunit of U3-containing 90S preribosome complex involved in production of 18S rRNA and assembly of small ribosomal subunit [Kazachstania barnettii]CAD1782651.1 similar to Saccharomyces cerevisiae YKR060W UTP30 Subunit of U3-containing 90S preribosome complex involved in production of 18S rRNA and assembly of small ribosomal subunit [Kazachstania barnettii]
MSSQVSLKEEDLSRKALESLIEVCKQDPKLAEDKDVQIVINTTRKMGVPKDYIPRIIPLQYCKLNKPRDLRTLLITKDPSTIYRDAITKDEPVNDLIKEIITVKNLKRRFRGSKLNELYSEFDIVVADYRVHHLLPKVLGTRFFHGSKKLPFMIRMSKNLKVKRQQMVETCDTSYIRAQLKSIYKNAHYIPNEDNCLNIKIGQIGKQNVDEMIYNVLDIVTFLTDSSKKPQGGVIKGGIESIYVKTSNSSSLPLYSKSEQPVADDDDDSELEL